MKTTPSLPSEHQDLGLAIRSRSWRAIEWWGGRWLDADPDRCIQILLEHWGNRPARMAAFLRACANSGCFDRHGLGAGFSDTTQTAVARVCGQYLDGPGSLSDAPPALGKLAAILIPPLDKWPKRNLDWRRWYRRCAAERSSCPDLFTAMQPSSGRVATELNEVALALFSKRMIAFPGPNDADEVFHDALRRRCADPRPTGDFGATADDLGDVLMGGNGVIPAGCLWAAARAFVPLARSLPAGLHHLDNVPVAMAAMAPQWRAAEVPEEQIDSLIADALNGIKDGATPEACISAKHEAVAIKWLSNSNRAQKALADLFQRSAVSYGTGQMIAGGWLVDEMLLDLIERRPDWLECDAVNIRHARLVLRLSAGVGASGVGRKI